jgi:UPF0716 protein FxsA
MGRILFALFTIVPLIEIACFILIGQAIGLWPTLAGVLVTALLGAFLIRMQGLALLTEIRQTMGRGQLPARAMGDAIMVGVAGALLIAPGYFTDLLGILLLVPPVRSLIYRFLAARMTVVTPARMRPQRPGVIDLDDSDWRPR